MSHILDYVDFIWDLLKTCQIASTLLIWAWSESNINIHKIFLTLHCWGNILLKIHLSNLDLDYMTLKGIIQILKPNPNNIY
jgi:hypothetical protein